MAMRHFAAPLSRAESDAWGARMQAHIAAHGWGFWAVAGGAVVLTGTALLVSWWRRWL